MTARILLDCPHCGSHVVVALGAPLAEGKSVPLQRAPLVAPATAAKKPHGVCACGHEGGFHTGLAGACKYGHGTALGGCTCECFHGRKRGGKACVPRAAGHQVAGSRTPYERAMLTVLAQRHPKTTTREQMSFLSGKSHRSSAFDACLAELRRDGLVDGAGDALVITSAGFDALPAWDPLPTGDALLAHWVRRVGPYAGSLLEIIVDEYPKAIERDVLSEVSGKSSTSSQFDASLSLLRKFDLIDGLRATEEFVRAVRGS